MDLQQLNELNEKRRVLRPLLSTDDAADAVTSYYALWHDPRRTQITLHYDAQRRVDGFVTVSQTGIDLFRPMVTLRAASSAVAGELLGSALGRNRPYLVIAPLALAAALREHLDIVQASLNRIYVMNPARLQRIANVLVQRVSTADGAPRFEIQSQGEVMALAGTNWRSPTFAEIFVYTHPKARGRGWGRSVVSACTAAVLDEGLRPLYVVDEGNEASIRTAEIVGYADSGLREFAGEGRLK